MAAGPAGSYEWHKAVFFWGGDHAEEEEDAFRSGWLRALYEVNERLIAGAEVDQVLKNLGKEAGS